MCNLSAPVMMGDMAACGAEQGLLYCPCWPWKGKLKSNRECPGSECQSVGMAPHPNSSTTARYPTSALGVWEARGPAQELQQEPPCAS